MAKAGFTYEVRKLPTDPVWIEDYVVRTRDGGSVGTVGAVLERAGERLIVVDRGVVPAHDRRVVPWRDVDRIDHDAVAVWLRLDEATFERDALELDPERGVEEGPAEARRLSEPPDDLTPPPEQQPAGPVDRSLPIAAVTLLGLGAFLLLVVVLVVSLSEEVWPLVFAVVPAGLIVASAVLGYRSYRDPYRPRPAQKP